MCDAPASFPSLQHDPFIFSLCSHPGCTGVLVHDAMLGKAAVHHFADMQVLRQVQQVDYMTVKGSQQLYEALRL